MTLPRNVGVADPVRRDELPVETDQLLREIRDALLRIEQRLPSDPPLLHALREVVPVGTAFSSSELVARGFSDDAVGLGRRIAELENRGVKRAGRDSSGTIWVLM